jgi:hypothetical protein
MAGGTLPGHSPRYRGDDRSALQVVISVLPRLVAWGGWTSTARRQAGAPGRRHGGDRLRRRFAGSALPPGFASSLGPTRRLTPTGFPGPCAHSGARMGLAPLRSRPSRSGGRLDPSRPGHCPPHTKPPSIEEGGFVMPHPSASPDLDATFHTRAPKGANAACSIGCVVVGESRSVV